MIPCFTALLSQKGWIWYQYVLGPKPSGFIFFLSFFLFSLKGLEGSVSDTVAAKNPVKVVCQSTEPLVLRLRHITFHLLSQPPLKVCHVVNTFPLMTQWERI